jgi:hypothetical protein
MFAIDIGLMFEEAVAKPHDNMLGKRVYFNFEVYFASFMDFVGTVDKQEIISYFC